MPATPTPRLGLHRPSRTDTPDVPSDLATLTGQLDEAAIYRTGTLAARPAASAVPAGTIFRVTDTDRVYLSTGASWVELGGEPVGLITAFAGSSAPPGRLMCDGAAVSRTTYDDLFAAIGTTFGAGNGSTTFNVPDLRGRVPVGVDGSANRLDASDALADTGGEQKHQLATVNLPAHAHAVTDPGHGHQTGPNSNYWPPINMPGSTVTGIGVGTANAGLAAVSNNTTGISIQNTGGGGSHNNMQPYQIVNYIIKT